MLTALRGKLEVVFLQDRHDCINNCFCCFRRGSLADSFTDNLAGGAADHDQLAGVELCCFDQLF